MNEFAELIREEHGITLSKEQIKLIVYSYFENARLFINSMKVMEGRHATITMMHLGSFKVRTKTLFGVWKEMIVRRREDKISKATYLKHKEIIAKTLALDFDMGNFKKEKMLEFTKKRFKLCLDRETKYLKDKL